MSDASALVHVRISGIKVKMKGGLYMKIDGLKR